MADELREILSDDSKLTELSNSILQEYDVNQTGRIEGSELRKAILNLAASQNVPPPADDKIEETFLSLDIDKSGSLDAQEFKVFIKSALESLLKSIS